MDHRVNLSTRYSSKQTWNLELWHFRVLNPRPSSCETPFRPMRLLRCLQHPLQLILSYPAGFEPDLTGSVSKGEPLSDCNLASQQLACSREDIVLNVNELRTFISSSYVLSRDWNLIDIVIELLLPNFRQIKCWSFTFWNVFWN